MFFIVLAAIAYICFTWKCMTILSTPLKRCPSGKTEGGSVCNAFVVDFKSSTHSRGRPDLNCMHSLVVAGSPLCQSRKLQHSSALIRFATPSAMIALCHGGSSHRKYPLKSVLDLCPGDQALTLTCSQLGLV